MLPLRTRQGSQQTLYLCGQRNKFRECSGRLEVKDHIHGFQPISSPRAAKDLANLSLEAMTHHRLAHFTASRDSEPDILLLVGMKVNRHQGSVPFPTQPITAHEILAPTQPLVAAQSFTGR